VNPIYFLKSEKTTVLPIEKKLEFDFARCQMPDARCQMPDAEAIVLGFF